MTSEQQSLLDAIRAFKPKDVTDTEALLNIITNHANQILTLNNRVKHLEKVLEQISQSASNRQLIEG